ncbi:hypothetical protein CIPAW_12G052600 [Carya illinoinensis]|uniref:Uncharacterized protein n=1 Tax=Carya illinoinensis TaxID=32201 RepID=A0A8T1NXJ2_CARIL|nr:hypothetical protein CIPAW_12G052600 [Carya illinoinensis]
MPDNKFSRSKNGSSPVWSGLFSDSDLYRRTPNNNSSRSKNWSSPVWSRDLDPYGGLFDDKQTKILEIKEHLEDLDQFDGSLVELLQNLAYMDITFQALKVNY